MRAFNTLSAYQQGLATGCKALKAAQMCAMCAAKPALHNCGKCLLRRGVYTRIYVCYVYSQCTCVPAHTRRVLLHGLETPIFVLICIVQILELLHIRYWV